MTNYEHYKEQIDKIVRMGRMVAVEEKTGKVTSCNQISCSQCKFYSCGCDCDCDCDCDTAALAWADAEYIEPKVDWYKVAVDTPILVSLDGVEWEKRHFAEYINGHVRAWKDGRTSWVTKSVSDWTYARLAKEECLAGEQE